MKYFISGFAAASFVFLSALPLQAEPNNLPLCYMITSSGRLINLDSLCIKGAINNYYQQLERLTSPRFNYVQFQALKIGMKYSRVVEILGSEGTEIRNSEAGDGTETVTYGWKNSDGSGIIAVFEGGSKAEMRTLIGKTQSRLR
ncbi:MAG: hypothetical protein ACK456_06330 [Pseudanabaenaceae cyanobacterium]